MSPWRLHSVCAAIVIAGVACAHPAPTPSRLAAACVSQRPGWALPSTGPRVLTVALAVSDQSRDGWHIYGSQRLRSAVASWNAQVLPLRLRVTPSLGTADIRVSVLETLPPDTASTATLRAYRAGVTRLDVDPSGALRRAHVGIAERSPLGARYTVDEQVATLLHELGHAIGLPHAEEPLALMSSQPIVAALTPADARLAIAVLRGSCQPALVARR